VKPQKKTVRGPIVTTIEEGQPYVDQPTYESVPVLVGKEPMTGQTVRYYTRVPLKWMKPGPDGNLVPRAELHAVVGPSEVMPQGLVIQDNDHYKNCESHNHNSKCADECETSQYDKKPQRNSHEHPLGADSTAPERCNEQ